MASTSVQRPFHKGCGSTRLEEPCSIQIIAGMDYSSFTVPCMLNTGNFRSMRNITFSRVGKQ
jgi:hypothetical protein